MIFKCGTGNENFGYTGGEEILSGAADGTLIVRDARGKVLNFANENGIVTARGYVSGTAGTIDGRGLSGYEFIAGVGCGSDMIFGADSTDVINLMATSLDQISGSNVNANGVELSFTDGSTLTIAGEVNATFTLSDGSAYVANQSTGQWMQTNSVTDKQKTSCEIAGGLFIAQARIYATSKFVW